MILLNHMKNRIIKVAFISLAVFCFSNYAEAATTIHLKISTPSNTLYDQAIPVDPCDSDNDATTAAIATPYCALLQLQPQIQSDWSWDATYSAYFLNSINNIAGSITKDSKGNDVYHYWSWSIGSEVAMVGLSAYELQPNDIISLDFIDPIDPATVPTGNSGLGGSTAPSAPVETATPVTATPSVTPDTTLESSSKPVFDLEKAFAFIISQQKTDGSFSEGLYTDWTALALASGNYQAPTIKLVKYLGGTGIENMSLTDYERHSMALMALGLNPYNTNQKNYIEKIISSFDGTQFGDVNEDNDDIFALIVLQNVGFNQSDKIINDDLNFVLSKQKSDGSWDGNVDMTGAAIEALSSFSPKTDPLPTSPLAGGGVILNALAKAKEFLKQNQKDDGSFGNVSSTAWAIEGILALGEKSENWTKNENSPLDYLATNQDVDGGMKDANIQNKLWETVYVASALSGKTWNQIMQKFEKPELPTATKVIVKNPKKITEGEMLSASAINAVPSPTLPAETGQTATPKKGWFTKLLDSIFSIF